MGWLQEGVEPMLAWGQGTPACLSLGGEGGMSPVGCHHRRATEWGQMCPQRDGVTPQGGLGLIQVWKGTAQVWCQSRPDVEKLIPPPPIMCWGPPGCAVAVQMWKRFPHEMCQGTILMWKRFPPLGDGFGGMRPRS